MCGIAGYLDTSGAAEERERLASRMLASLAHRGPDDGGLWQAAGESFIFGHRRLAIQDLTSAGHQPMRMAGDRWVITYNGELYNADRLRRELPKAIPWRGHSDTEVLLHGFAHWGIRRTLDRAAGMFAIAVWDRERRTITLIRDRLGIKPLFYSFQGSRLFWASELKALLANDLFQATINEQTMSLFLKLGYIPAPHSIFHHTWKLQPGHVLTVPVDRFHEATLECYWNATEVADRQMSLTPSTAERSDEGDERLLQATHERLCQYAQEHTVGDVPYGVFLSSGIDSSLLTAILRRDLGHEVKSFSIGFADSPQDEAPQARQIAEFLGTQHETHYVTEADVLDWIPRWSEIYCEPFADSSGLPTILVSNFARQHVKMALSGDGGDELFAGYRRYQQARLWSSRLQRIPSVAKRVVEALLDWPTSATCQRWDRWQRWIAPNIKEGMHESRRKLRELLGSDSEQTLYECLHSVSYNFYREHLREDLCHDNQAALPLTGSWRAERPCIENMQLWDTEIYLPNDILPKVDLASMSVGLEVRVPLLDHRLYEWAWSLPSHLRYQPGKGKVALRRLLERYLPAPWIDQPKRGFSAPLGRWLTGPLRDWAESLLSPDRLEQTGFFRTSAVTESWHDLLAGRAGFARIWPILVFQSWHEEYLRTTRTDHEYSLRNQSGDSLPIGRVSQYGPDVPEPCGAGPSRDFIGGA